jgi:hypothetical protein
MGAAAGGVYMLARRTYMGHAALANCGSVQFRRLPMRAEAEKLADAVRQSLTLLRRHL